MNKLQVLLRNIGFNFLAQFWFMALSFFTTPYIINHLGLDAFGVYSIIGVVMGYFSFLDLGLGNAIIKYLAEYYGQRDYKKITRIIGTSLVAYTIIGFFGALILSFTSGLIINQLLHIPVNLRATAQFSLYISAIGFLINMPLAIFGSIPNALQRMDITNIRNIIIGTANTLGIIFLLSKGYGLSEIVILNVTLSVIGIIVYVIASKKLLPEVSFKFEFDSQMFGKLLSFGIFKFLNQISGQIIFQLDKLLIGLYLPIAYVSYYTVPLTLASKAMSFVFNVAGAFFPTASELSGREDKQPFYNLYVRSMKLVSLLVIPIFTMLFIFAYEVLSFWVKKDFPQKSTITLELLAMAYLIQSFTTVPSLAAESLGNPKITAQWAFITAIINLVLSIIFIPIYQINGAALAIFLNSLIVCPISVVIINKKVIKFSNRQLFKQAILRSVVAVAVVIPIYFFLKLWLVKNLMTLLLAFVIGEACFLTSAYLVKAIDNKDKELIAAFINRFKKI